MKGENLLFVFAVLAAVLAITMSLYLYNSLQELRTSATGYAAAGIQQNATINITISSNLLINFTNSSISFGSGAVTVGASQANVSTNGSGGSVQAGTWATPFPALVLENVGNVNATITFNFTDTASTYLGGTSPNYTFNVSNIEANSCNFSFSNANVAPYYNISLNSNFTQVVANHTTWGFGICTPLDYQTGSNSIRVDIRLTIPSNSRVGSLQTNITAIASQY